MFAAMTFADEIHAERERLRLTQTELARMLRVSKQTVSNWETGRAVPWDRRRHLHVCRIEAQSMPAETIIDRIMTGPA